MVKLLECNYKPSRAECSLQLLSLLPQFADTRDHTNSSKISISKDVHYQLARGDLARRSRLSRLQAIGHIGQGLA